MSDSYHIQETDADSSSSPDPTPDDSSTDDTVRPGETDDLVPTIEDVPESQSVIRSEDLTVHYGDEQALQSVTVGIPEREVTAIIGPSGCGKSTYLRCLNRMNDMIDAAKISGTVRFRGTDIYAEDIDPVALRRKIGMVFQKPNPFPKSIYDNVAYGLKIQGFEGDMDARVEEALRNAALWDEVKDQLDSSGLDLSGGQQQRLCIARAIAPDPEVVLMDEPASALDPVATAKVEDLIADLSEQYTVIIVTHNMQQAARISDKTAVFLTGGQLVEFGNTDQIFENPENQRVEDYITGKFG
ncbi:phosphate ABC transporter ATP-binding protein, PhoT family [Halopenitus malekzadehii]|uniref:Phosphate ABC transporter ATP-binding protein, PhoT family n=1 Tax=Halopenitus malekzadehii TaxID=1267564 RepID=A0A1H6IWL1_9EURY|nr:phosphate ABC transporter ATP-binding protein PstB [Halopenitus malekzadehii]SEH52064.1 phosphate ABC transporter ATP-binding protein, PhoT family [Halopenitus malekzadehii]